MLKHLIQKDFAQKPKFNLADELNCWPSVFQKERQQHLSPLLWQSRSGGQERQEPLHLCHPTPRWGLRA
jgi:hypothetical protein